MKPLEHRGQLGPLEVELEMWQLGVGVRARYEVRWSWAHDGGVTTVSHLETTAVVAYRVFEQVRRQLARGEPPGELQVTATPAAESPEATIRRAVERASGVAQDRVDRLRGNGRTGA